MEIKNIFDALKLVILVLVLLMGFWATYGVILTAVGVTMTSQVMWISFGVSASTEYLFLKWFLGI